MPNFHDGAAYDAEYAAYLVDAIGQAGASVFQQPCTVDPPSPAQQAAAARGVRRDGSGVPDRASCRPQPAVRRSPTCFAVSQPPAVRPRLLVPVRVGRREPGDLRARPDSTAKTARSRPPRSHRRRSRSRAEPAVTGPGDTPDTRAVRLPPRSARRRPVADALVPQRAASSTGRSSVPTTTRRCSSTRTRRGTPASSTAVSSSGSTRNVRRRLRSSGTARCSTRPPTGRHGSPRDRRCVRRHGDRARVCCPRD